MAARGGVWDACAREEVPRGGQVALGDSLGPFGRGCTMDEVHRWCTAGGGETEQAGRREMEIRAFL